MLIFCIIFWDSPSESQFLLLFVKKLENFHSKTKISLKKHTTLENNAYLCMQKNINTFSYAKRKHYYAA